MVQLKQGTIPLVTDSWGEIIRQSPNPSDFGRSFYEGHLFIRFPRLRTLFAGKDMQKQYEILTAGLSSFVERLSGDPVQLESWLKDLGRRHAGYKVKDEYYAPAGAELIKTLRYFLKSAFTLQVEAAWADAYDLISTSMLEGARETMSD